jgi:hypothetical protein
MLKQTWSTPDHLLFFADMYILINRELTKNKIISDHLTLSITDYLRHNKDNKKRIIIIPDCLLPSELPTRSCPTSHILLILYLWCN